MAGLRVAEASVRDVGRGIVRVDPREIEEMGAQVGEVVLVRGKRATVAKLLPCFPEDRGKKIVQLDGVLRENAQVGVGETVELDKVAPKPAEKLLLCPLSLPAGIRGDGRYLAGVLDSMPVVEGDRLRANLFGTQFQDFRALKTWPSGPVQIHGKTAIEVQARESGEPRKDARISYEDIGGLRKEVQKIREMIELPLRYPEVFERLGIEPPKGVLIHGPPGCGKTLIARAVANETEAHFIHISGPQIMNKFYGESEANLREIFEEAKRRAPAIVFIDEIDSIAPKREDLGGEKQVERRVVAQLLALLDGIESRGQVIVIAATNLPNMLDPALRRPGRFDREISIPISDRQGRKEILEIHTRGMPLREVSLDHLARITHGFVGADLEALAREAAMRCLRRVLPRFDLSREGIPFEALAKLEVTAEDFQEALKEVEPSALREFIVEVPSVRWSDIGGLEEVKERLREAVEWPLAHAELFRRAGLRPPKGVLISGPPGTGKTLLAKAVATESEANFISVRGPEVYSRYVGDSERAIREIFRRARQATPCVIFFDEFDALAPARDRGGDSLVTERVLGQLLAEMDGLEKLSGVLVVAATNRREALDPALLRPGRVDWIIDIPPPDEKNRLEILRVLTREMPLAKDADLARVARETEGWSGADLESVCREAAMTAVRNAVAAGARAAGKLTIGRSHFERALGDVRKQVP